MAVTILEFLFVVTLFYVYSLNLSQIRFVNGSVIAHQNVEPSWLKTFDWLLFANHCIHKIKCQQIKIKISKMAAKMAAKMAVQNNVCYN